MLTTLKGIRVLDIGLYFAGPYSSRLLSDLGADVIKLEPLDGDLLRPTTKAFNGAARGKRSIAANLKHPAGLEIAHRLAARADVVTHNMRPGVVERLKVDYETIRSFNPQIIYAFAPGWGSSGPDSGRPGFAPMFSGYCGLQHEAAGEGNDPALPVGNEDNGNGLVGAGAILMALYHRKRTGMGQYLEYPQLSATLLMGMYMMRRPDGTVIGARGLDAERQGIHPLDRLYETSDGWLCVSCRLDREFCALVSLSEFAAIGADPRFIDEESRVLHKGELQRSLAVVFRSATAAEWAEQLGGVGVPCEIPAGTDSQQRFFQDPEQEQLGRVETYIHPQWGEVKDVAVLVRMSGSGERMSSRPAPQVGENTREILAEVDYSEAEIDGLFSDGVVV